MYDLSILIPARNEEWLPQTIEDLLKNKRGKTEILVGLDGYTIDLPKHPDLRVLHKEQSIGQRAMQNRLCEMSEAKYVAKTDAHCAFDEGFDIKLMNRMEDDITMVPVMRNLHVFDWVCDNCGMRTYQGPAPEACRNEICDAATDGGEGNHPGHHKEIVWNPKPNPQSSAYRFNKLLRFKYFPELRAKLPKEGLQETMSLQGSFFMCTREKYWSLKLCDESWGSWGQQGSEVALKTWLSGGRVMCNFDTWYAHLFRTQPGFSFPYSMGSSQHNARKICEDIFLNDKWEHAIHPLTWLIEKFWFALKDVRDPEARWEESDLRRPTKGILYFTDNQLNLKLARDVQKRIIKIAEDKGMELVSSSRKPMAMGKNVLTPEPRGYLTMFKQILKGLENMTSDIVFMAEHDVLYPPEHFDFTPPEHKFYYDQNWWKIHPDGFAISWDADQVSGLCAYRQDLIDYYRHRVETFNKDKFDRKFEPYSGIKSEAWKAPRPHIDIRHGRNLTYNKRSLKDFRNKESAVNLETSTIQNIPGWDPNEINLFTQHQ